MAALTRDEVLRTLRTCVDVSSGRGSGSDAETAHMDADLALLQYINDEEITETFMAIRRWYA